ncbi:MAG: hypothetical protein KA974_10250 [Saprospiraceae bacterium]|nr:hypothetical protein [Saprospiraceae bacterium]
MKVSELVVIALAAIGIYVVGKKAMEKLPQMMAAKQTTPIVTESDQAKQLASINPEDMIPKTVEVNTKEAEIMLETPMQNVGNSSDEVNSWIHG